MLEWFKSNAIQLVAMLVAVVIYVENEVNSLEGRIIVLETDKSHWKGSLKELNQNLKSLNENIGDLKSDLSTLKHINGIKSMYQPGGVMKLVTPASLQFSGDFWATHSGSPKPQCFAGSVPLWGNRG